MEKLKGKYGLLTAICMVVGTVIGSGVFFKAQNVLEATGGNMPLGIAAWAITGLIMIICSAQFAVMATKYVKVNGVEVARQASTITSYNVWDTPVIEGVEIAQGDVITVGVYVKCSGSGNGAWGKIDDAKLNTMK